LRTNYWGRVGEEGGISVRKKTKKFEEGPKEITVSRWTGQKNTKQGHEKSPEGRHSEPSQKIKKPKSEKGLPGKKASRGSWYQRE